MLAHARQALRHSPVEIESAANPRLRHLRDLLESGRERRRSGQTVLEGWHLLESWLAGGRPVLQLVLPRRTFQQLGQGGEPSSPASRREHGRSPSANPWQRVSPQGLPGSSIPSGEAAGMNGNPEMATLAAHPGWRHRPPVRNTTSSSLTASRIRATSAPSCARLPRPAFAPCLPRPVRPPAGPPRCCVPAWVDTSCWTSTRTSPSIS